MIGPIYVSCIVQKILMSTIHQRIFQIIISFSSLLSVFLLITNRKRRSLTPYSTKKNLYGEHRFASWFGTMASFRAPNLLSTEHAWNKEGVAWSQRWLPYHLPEGYLGVTGVGGPRQNESNRTLGNSPRRWRRARAYINITHILELEHTTLSISRSTVSLQDLFVLKINPISHAFLSFFSRCTMLKRSNILCPFTNLIIYIEI